jgi:hypothetical protein
MPPTPAEPARRPLRLPQPQPQPHYAELSCRSNFSFLCGASHPRELLARARALGYSALAITDECSLAGVVRAHEEAERLGMPLIVGAQMDLWRQPPPSASGLGARAQPAPSHPAPAAEYTGLDDTASATAAHAALTRAATQAARTVAVKPPRTTTTAAVPLRLVLLAESRPRAGGRPRASTWL